MKKPQMQYKGFHGEYRLAPSNSYAFIAFCFIAVVFIGTIIFIFRN